MITSRQAISTGGVFDKTTWVDAGESLAFAAFTSTSTPTELAVQTIVGATGNAVDVSNTVAIQHLYGFYVHITTAGGLAAQSTLNLGLNVRRAGAQLGSATTFGWLASLTGTPTLTALVPVLAPAIPVATNASVLTASNGTTRFVRLLPGDVITLVASSAGSISVPAGLITTLIN
jgi:hypothetical protein